MGDIDGNIVDIHIGNKNMDERAASRGMIRKNKKHINKVIMDGYHDCKDTFDLYDQLGIDVRIKIMENASGKGFGPRSRKVRLYQNLGRKYSHEVRIFSIKNIYKVNIFDKNQRFSRTHTPAENVYYKKWIEQKGYGIDVLQMKVSFLCCYFFEIATLVNQRFATL